VAPDADGSQVGGVAAAAGLGLDDVIDLGGIADADVGVAQLAPVAVSLEHLLADGLPAGAVGVEVGRWRVRPGSPPALGAPGWRLPARNDRDLVAASGCEADSSGQLVADDRVGKEPDPDLGDPNGAFRFLETRLDRIESVAQAR